MPGATLTAVGLDDVDPLRLLVDVGPDTVRGVKIFVTAPSSSLQGAEMPIIFHVRDTAGGEGSSVEDVFKGPAR